MAQILLRNLSERTKSHVQRRAKRNGRSRERDTDERDTRIADIVLATRATRDEKHFEEIARPVVNSWR